MYTPTEEFTVVVREGEIERGSKEREREGRQWSKIEGERKGEFA